MATGKILNKQFRLLAFLLWFIFWLRSATAACNVCMSNQVACVNRTSFYPCYGTGVPNKDQLQHCLAGLECSDLNAICVQPSPQRPPICVSPCGQCSAQRNYVYACQSRTTFQMCYGAAEPSGIIGHCPANYVCDANSDEICVPIAQATSITCDRDEETEVDTTTTTTTQTPIQTVPTTIAPITPTQLCIQRAKVGLQTLNDPYCRDYLYCSYDSNKMLIGVKRSCTSGSYFNSIILACVINKPVDCL